MAGKKDYSISFRLRRTNYEEAFVSVPVTDDVMLEKPDEYGHRRLNVEKLTEMAIRLGSDAQIRWRVEGKPIVELHPVQVAPNEDTGDPSQVH